MSLVFNSEALPLKSKILIFGASGKMGVKIKELLDSACFEAEFCFGATSKTAKSELDLAIKGCDVIIDFSHPDALFNYAHLAIKHSKLIVSGTTGFSKEQEGLILSLVKNDGLKIIMSYNTSFGVNVFFKIAKELSKALNIELCPEYDAEIIETHHVLKKDAPSGTAITLGKCVAEGRGLDFDKVKCFERSGITGQKPSGQIGFASVRSGGIVGEHTLIFGSGKDTIELTHRAFSRDIFAEGAIKLALQGLKKLKAGQLNESKIYEYKDIL